MKNFIIAFLVFLIWSIFGLWFYSWLQPETISAILKSEIIENKLLEVPNIDKPSTKETDSIAFKNRDNNSNIEDNKPIYELENNKGLKATNDVGDIIFIFSEGVSIKKNSTKINIPLSVVDYKYKINTYLLEHPDQELHICSLYSPLEEILKPNIGLQRANELKLLLIETGIQSEKIVVKSIIKDFQFTPKNTFNNSIYFTFKPLNIERVHAEKNKKPLSKIIYPAFSESGILLNKTLKSLLKELKFYFKNNPNKKIELVGHTDNIGNSIDNYNLGLKHSKQVRWFLVSKGGFNKSLITATSKGESEPIENNKTYSGRIANKRIEVIFK